MKSTICSSAIPSRRRAPKDRAADAPEQEIETPTLKPPCMWRAASHDPAAANDTLLRQLAAGEDDVRITVIWR
ncbi:hypothetical protein [Sedimentitalea todarodis]|uniref:Uncharacterized protein n=1 Tax=Sedimentitalea todarodis TaxID=1631240 RepID=A0ABU3VFS9_9RHOB|nr:hypothetical protein [Sedimentitalea todarodis]MDU9004559.1 hypothetical protein [Sedimentitalea todarodis]